MKVSVRNTVPSLYPLLVIFTIALQPGLNTHWSSRNRITEVTERPTTLKCWVTNHHGQSVHVTIYQALCNAGLYGKVAIGKELDRGIQKTMIPEIPKPCDKKFCDLAEMQNVTFHDNSTQNITTQNLLETTSPTHNMVQHCGSSLMLRGCLSSKGIGALVKMEGKVDGY